MDLAQRFDADRRHLRSVAFRLLGSVAGADDAVQAAWLLRARRRLHARPAVEPSRAAEHLAVVEGFAQRPRAGSVLLIDGAPGIVIAPHGRAQALLRVGFGADNRVHSIDITGDPDRLRRAVLALPSRPSQQHHSPIGYQGHRRQPARPPATGQHRERHAR